MWCLPTVKSGRNPCSRNEIGFTGTANESSDDANTQYCTRKHSNTDRTAGIWFFHYLVHTSIPIVVLYISPSHTFSLTELTLDKVSFSSRLSLTKSIPPPGLIPKVQFCFRLAYRSSQTSKNKKIPQTMRIILSLAAVLAALSSMAASAMEYHWRSCIFLSSSPVNLS